MLVETLSSTLCDYLAKIRFFPRSSKSHNTKEFHAINNSADRLAITKT